MSKLTSSLVVALGLVAFTGCKKKKEEGTVQKPVEGSAMVAPQPAQPEPEKPMAGADLATKYQKCVAMISDNKLDDVRKDCIDDSFNVHDMGTGQDRSGADALVGYFKTMKTAMPDWKLTPQVVIVSGRNILAVDLITGTHTGELAMPGMPPVPATQKKIGMFMFHRLAINDQNKATEEWAYMDPMTMTGQLGLNPKDAPPTRPAVDKGIDGAPIVAVTADDAKEKANLEAAKKGIDSVNSHKIADMMAMFTDDALVSDQTDGKDHKGKKEIEASEKQMMGAFSDAKVSAENLWAAGDWVALTGKFEGTNDHDMGKMKKTGKKVSLDAAELAHMKDGKIDQLWRFHSGMQFAMQMGMMPAPGAAPAAGSAAPAAGSAAPAAGSAAAAPAGEKKADKKADKAEKAPETK